MPTTKRSKDDWILVYYLSLVDETRPKGEQFLWAAFLPVPPQPAPDVLADPKWGNDPLLATVLRMAHAAGLNQSGAQVQPVGPAQVPYSVVKPYLLRRLSKADIAAFDRVMAEEVGSNVAHGV